MGLINRMVAIRCRWLPLCVCAVILALAGCVARSVDPGLKFDAADERGLVLIGFNEVRAPGQSVSGHIAVAKFDPDTGSITGGNSVVLGPDGFMISNIFGIQRYRAYHLRPGEYAFTQLHSKASRGPMQQDWSTTRLVDFDKWQVLDSTPTFTVKAGEVTYVGDAQVSFDRFPAGLNILVDTAAATEFLKTMPNVKVDQLVVRPIRDRKSQSQKAALTQ